MQCLYLLGSARGLWWKASLSSKAEGISRAPFWTSMSSMRGRRHASSLHTLLVDMPHVHAISLLSSWTRESVGSSRVPSPVQSSLLQAAELSRPPLLAVFPQRALHGSPFLRLRTWFQDPFGHAVFPGSPRFGWLGGILSTDTVASNSAIKAWRKPTTGS